MRYLAVFLQPITNLWDSLSGAVHNPVQWPWWSQSIGVITLVSVGLAMVLLELGRRRNKSMHMNLSVILVEDNNRLYKYVIDLNKLTGYNLKVLYMGSSSREIKEGYIMYHGSMICAVTPNPDFHEMDSIVDDYDVNVYKEIAADNTIASSDYVTTLRFPAPKRTLWEYLTVNYDLKAYNDGARIYITTDEESGEDILKLTIRKHNLLNRYTLISEI